MAENNYRSYAALAREEAETATLDNVKERCMRSAAAWTAMAERQERVERARVHNRNAVPQAEQLPEQIELEKRETQPIEIE